MTESEIQEAVGRSMMELGAVMDWLDITDEQRLALLKAIMGVFQVPMDLFISGMKGKGNG